MRRFALALSAIVVGVVVSSCAVGVRQPATAVTATSATLHGNVLSTTGGPGSWHIEYGPTEARTERTPTREVDFVVNESKPVSEPVAGLEPGTTYHYAVCAEDSENPGDAFCSPDQTVSTPLGVATLTLTPHCDFGGARYGFDADGTDFPPNQSVALISPGRGVRTQADANGKLSRITYGFSSPVGLYVVRAYENPDNDLTPDSDEALLAVAEIDDPCATSPSS
jgi:hypothetical protein